MALAAVAAVLGASASPVHYAWPAYHNNTQLYAEWEALATGSCSDRVKLATEDTTVDGWDLKTASFGTGKTKVMYVFGIHGREYLGAEVGLALMRRLCEKDDPRITKLLSDVTFKLFPLMNPSGRAGNLPEKKISGEHDEECVLRRTNANQIDLNRNFDAHWGDGESTPGAVDYRGTAPQTEVETILLAKAGHEFQPDLYVDVHTGAFATLTPYSYTETDTDPEEMRALMSLLGHVKDSENFTFTSLPDAGQGSQLLYVAMGTTMDYFFEEVGTPYAYTWETYDQERVAMAHRLSASEVALATRPSWTPDMPQMKAYKQRMHARLLQEGEQQKFPRSKAVADVALQPDQAATPQLGGYGCSPGVLPDQLCDDSCFAFYNPIQQRELEHYVNSWLENLVKASEYVVQNPRPNRKSKQR